MLGNVLSVVTTKQPLEVDDSHIYNSVACCVDENGNVNMVVCIYVVRTVVVVYACFEVVDLVAVKVMDVIGPGTVVCVLVVVVIVVVATVGLGLGMLVVVPNSESSGLIVEEIAFVVCVYVKGIDIVGGVFVVDVDMMLGKGMAVVAVVNGVVMLEADMIVAVIEVGVSVVNGIDVDIVNTEPVVVNALLCMVGLNDMLAIFVLRLNVAFGKVVLGVDMGFCTIVAIAIEVVDLVVV